jgi:hypothetical protein
MADESLWDQIKSNWKSAQDQGIVPKTLTKPEARKAEPQRVEQVPSRKPVKKVARKR